MSYKTKVEEMTGSMTGITGYTADKTMDNWLQATIREVMTMVPANLKLIMTKSYTDSDGSAGIALGSDGGARILYGHKKYYRAQKGIVADKARYASGSIYAPTATSPIFYVERNKGYMLPDGGTFEVLYLPVIVSTDDYSSYADGDTIVPEEIEHIIVTGTSVKAKNLQVFSKRIDYNNKVFELVIDRPAISIDSPPEYPAVASFAMPESLSIPIEPVLNFSHIEELMVEEDSELMTSRGEVMSKRVEDFNFRLQAGIERFKADLQLEMERFNADVKLSTEKSNSALQNYTLELDAEVKKSDINIKVNQEVATVATQLLEEYKVLSGELTHLVGMYAQELKMLSGDTGSPGVPRGVPAA
jgi:hypothetical protein